MVLALSRPLFPRWLVAPLLALATLVSASVAQAQSSDPAVAFMDRVAKEMMASARSRSPQAMQATMARYADTQALGLFALGDYRPRLEQGDRGPYMSGMIRFIGRYAATEAPKYPVARVTFNPVSRKAKYGLMVDSTLVLQDGTTYEVAWLLVRYGSTYKVRDVQVMGFWGSPFLKKMFEDYIAQNNGNVKTLVSVLQRH
jgi:phospholipid transport system substrate-binding protein